MKQKIIITGGAGFIGSNFLNRFVCEFRDIDFINIDALTAAGNIEKIAKKVHSSPNYFFENTNISDFENLEKIFKKYHPTDIIHFAAETHVDISIKNPAIFTESNIIGTQNLLELSKKYQLKKFHYISTDEVYGDIPKSGYFREDTPLKPSNPYSASKAAAEMLVMAYGRTFGVNYVISRSSNNYWPWQNSISLIPLFIEKICKNEKLPIYGDGSNIRDWLYVEDHIDAIWQVFTRGKFWEIYNIGGKNEYTNLQITKKILQKMNASDELITFVADRPGHDKRYALDISKIQNKLGWAPKIDFDDGITRTINFYKNIFKNGV